MTLPQRALSLPIQKQQKDGMKLDTSTDSVHQITPKKLRAAADQAMAIMRKH